MIIRIMKAPGSSPKTRHANLPRAQPLGGQTSLRKRSAEGAFSQKKEKEIYLGQKKTKTIDVEGAMGAHWDVKLNVVQKEP